VEDAAVGAACAVAMPAKSAKHPITAQTDHFIRRRTGTLLVMFLLPLKLSQYCITRFYKNL
jgi:hypothetical protein